MKLYIGNKNYSSWSMRVWTLMRHLDVHFEEVKIAFDGFDATSSFKQQILRINPAGTVPVLEHGGILVADTLAIAEYLAETLAQKHLWPQNRAARAAARAACARMHAGFGALRSKFPMNIEACLPDVGTLVLRDEVAVRSDVEQVLALWAQLLAVYGHSHEDQMLFGSTCIADFYFAPVVMRFRTYGVPVPAGIEAYMQRVCALKAVRSWVHDALAEHDFLDFEEPYRLGR